nr:8728_t:CDS:2 [Entrophospora candida]
MDFRISKDQFEMLIGLRSSGLPLAPKSKKWMDKVDLAVVLQDVLINKGIENNGIDPNKFHNILFSEYTHLIIILTYMGWIGKQEELGI